MLFAHPLRILLLAVLALQAVTTPTLGQEEVPPQDPFRVEVNLVTLRFSVRDVNGNLVNNLQAENFRVFESGVEQELVHFEPPRNRQGNSEKLQLAFLLDVSGSTFATRAEEIVAAQTFLDNVTDVTQIGIYGFTDTLIPFQKFTPSRDLALRAIREARRHMGKTAIYDSLSSLIAQMDSSSTGSGDKAIILLSDGLDEAHRKSIAAASLARQRGIKVYTVLVPSAAQIYIGPSSTGGSATASARTEDREVQEKAFGDLSIQTGGMHFSGFEAIIDFDDTLAQINDDLYGNLYSVGYYSDTMSTPLRSRSIQVQPDNTSLSVAIPFRKLPQQIEAKKTLIAALFSDSSIDVTGVDSTGFREIGAQLDVLSTQRESGDMISLPFRIKINPYSFAGALSGGVNTQVGIIALLIDSQGNEQVRLREVYRIDRGSKEIRNGRGIIYTNRLLAPAGDYELRVALLEFATWRLTSFERSVRIRPPLP